LISVLKRPASIVLTIAAFAAAAGIVAPAASAAPRTWTITKGGAVTAATKSFSIVDLTRKPAVSLPCKASTAKARLKSGRRLSGVGAGVITATSASGCTVAGFAITIKAAHLPWHLNLVSYNAAKGVTTGTLTGIHINFAVPAIGCTAMVDGTKATANNGSVVVTYTNKTAKLAILKAGTKLHLFNVNSKCLGVVKNGDLIAIVATYSVTPKQKITSP
jgi:hypothetical protein